MDIEEIRKNKPEGATHYLEHSNRYGRVNEKGFVELWHKSRNRFEEVPLRLHETVLKPL